MPEAPSKPVAPPWAGMDDFGGSDDPRDLLVPSPVPKESDGAGDGEPCASCEGVQFEGYICDGCGHVAGPFPDSEAATRTAILAGDLAADALTAAPHPLESRRNALVLRLLAAGFVEESRHDEPLRRFKATDWPVWVTVIPGGPAAEWDPDSAGLLTHAEADCARVEAARQARQGVAVEPLSGRWGQQHSAPLPDGLAGLGARGQEPLAPGPTLAEVQAENQQLRTLHSEAVAAREAAKRQRDEALAAAERERVQANEWLSQLHDANERIAALKASNTGIAQELADVNWTLNALGASGTGPAKERLMQVLPLPRVVALLEVEAAEADTVVKRIRCRNPDMTSGEEPLSTAMDREQEACERLRVARDRLDHLPEGGKMVEAE